MVAMGFVEALQSYTGLTPGAAATILALMLATYLLVSSLFVAPAAPSPAAPPKQQREEEGKEKEEEAPMPFVYPDPVEVGEVTLEQLRAYDGKDPAKQILIAIRGQVYDVSRGR
jgi:membrane-associated progesterone receptor component